MPGPRPVDQSRIRAHQSGPSAWPADQAGACRVDGAGSAFFRIRPADWGLADCRAVGIRGSFTGWRMELPLEGPDADGQWELCLPWGDVRVPGNSGLPEFVYLVDGWLELTADTAPEGWHVGRNFVILAPGAGEARTAEVVRRHRLGQYLKTSPGEYPDTGALANFRTVCGGGLPPGRLYRSYHPWLASRDTPVENLRLAAVRCLMAEAGIASVINLTDPPDILADPAMPPGYRHLADEGRVHFAATDYEHAYFAPDSPEFRAVLAGIAGFIATNPVPCLVHCRLGIDRTGVVCAFLGALAGVPWAGLVRDYLASNGLGIREYRDAALLEHSFRQLLGRDHGAINDTRRLSRAMADCLLASGLDEGQVKGCQDRLRG